MSSKLSIKQTVLGIGTLLFIIGVFVYIGTYFQQSLREEEQFLSIIKTVEVNSYYIANNKSVSKIDKDDYMNMLRDFYSDGVISFDESNRLREKFSEITGVNDIKKSSITKKQIEKLLSKES